MINEKETKYYRHPTYTFDFTALDGENAHSSLTDDDAPPPALVEKGTEWKVEEILGTRKRGRGHQVFVKWAGEEPTWEPTWEPLKNFLNYEEQHGKIAPSSTSPKV